MLEWSKNNNNWRDGYNFTSHQKCYPMAYGHCAISSITKKLPGQSQEGTSHRPTCKSSIVLILTWYDSLLESSEHNTHWHYSEYIMIPCNQQNQTPKHSHNQNARQNDLSVSRRRSPPSRSSKIRIFGWFWVKNWANIAVHVSLPHTFRFPPWRWSYL